MQASEGPSTLMPREHRKYNMQIVFRRCKENAWTLGERIRTQQREIRGNTGALGLMFAMRHGGHSVQRPESIAFSRR